MDLGFETLNGIAQTATSLTSALKGAADLVGSIKTMLKSTERRSDAEIEAAVERLALTMENARLNNALLEAHVLAMQQVLRRAQETEEKLQAYHLHKTPGGAIVYALKDPDTSGQPEHLICPHCYDEGRRSILQGYYVEKDCPRCKAKFPVGKWSIGL